MAEIFKGIFVGLDVQSHGDLDESLSKVSPKVGMPIEPADRHASVNYAADFLLAGLFVDRDDDPRLLAAEAEVDYGVGKLDIVGGEIVPSVQALRFVRRFVILPVENGEVVQEVHQISARTVKKHFDADIPDRDRHVSVLRRPNDAGWQRSRLLPPIPSGIVFRATGYRVEVCDITYVPKSLRQGR
jgi:hypothetical protein